MTDISSDAARAPHGFTLIEVLIVTAIIGFVALAIGATFSVIVRTSPSNEARTDDARSLLGLTNWIPADVASTGIDRFYFNEAASGCSSPAPGEGLLRLEWTQSSVAYSSNYRYVEEAGQHFIRRYACRDGQAAQAINLTGDLAPIAGAAPVNITPRTNGAGQTIGVEFEVRVVDPTTNAQRSLLSIDAFTENVPTTMPPLPPQPIAPTPTTAPNQAPVAQGFSYQVQETVTTDLFVIATDANNDSLTATIVSGPTWVTLIEPMKMRVVAPGGAATDPLNPFQVKLTVQDPAGAVSPEVTIFLEAVPSSATTTTTSTSTTTTVAPACVATIQNVTPSTTSNKTNQGNPTDVGKLVDEVRVSITSNGFCSPLVLAFNPDPNTASSEVLPFNGGQSVIFPANLLWRDSFGTPHPLQLREGVAGPVVHSAVLTVN